MYVRMSEGSSTGIAAFQGTQLSCVLGVLGVQHSCSPQCACLHVLGTFEDQRTGGALTRIASFLCEEGREKLVTLERNALLEDASHWGKTFLEQSNVLLEKMSPEEVAGNLMAVPPLRERWRALVEEADQGNLSHCALPPALMADNVIQRILAKEGSVRVFVNTKGGGSKYMQEKSYRSSVENWLAHQKPSEYLTDVPADTITLRWWYCSCPLSLWFYVFDLHRFVTLAGKLRCGAKQGATPLKPPNLMGLLYFAWERGAGDPTVGTGIHLDCGGEGFSLNTCLAAPEGYGNIITRVDTRGMHPFTMGRALAALNLSLVMPRFPYDDDFEWYNSKQNGVRVSLCLDGWDGLGMDG